MSRFREGWCRTAHEAMLLGRPVVGSGTGGMGELLRGGHQVICPSHTQLRSHVEALLANPRLAGELGRQGQLFARRFDLKRFRSEWIELLSSLSKSADAPQVERSTNSQQ
jgi:glycosyltransferase involved in cell wall biosynthesis